MVVAVCLKLHLGQLKTPFCCKVEKHNPSPVQIGMMNMFMKELPYSINVLRFDRYAVLWHLFSVFYLHFISYIKRTGEKTCL